MALMLAWEMFIAVGPGAAPGRCGRNMAKGTCKDV